MSKVNTNKKIQKPRTEQEMRAALSNFCKNKFTMCVPPQTDDDDVVLLDCIEELLEARQQQEDVRGFVMTMHGKLTRR